MGMPCIYYSAVGIYILWDCGSIHVHVCISWHIWVLKGVLKNADGILGPPEKMEGGKTGIACCHSDDLRP